MGKDASRRTSSWPGYNWILIALQLLSAAVVLVCLGWYGLKDRSGLPSDFMCWLPGVAAECAIVFYLISLSRVGEVVVAPNSEGFCWWILDLRVDGMAGPLSGCQQQRESPGRGRGEREIIVCGTFFFFEISLTARHHFNSVLSLTRIIIASFVRRRGPIASPDLDDCEKLYNASE
ncbi:hypothetical protein C7212DRAFT_289468 [Tuber magnatum]|uniref:Uncharacterized protein n=1 Tax=Tuber magnatum TaxID=42249 RepID=A0A317T0S2_9PEZI|nr:hypothetical protein C7212DRAFT_289468 [Tuber magnatum]